MKHRILSKRLRAVETALAAKRIGHVPSVLAVRAGETREQAFGRYAAKYPHRPPNHTGYLLVTAAKPETDDERTEYARRFKAQQMKIVSEARNRNAIATAAEPAFAPNAVWSAPRVPKHSPKPWRPDASR